MREAIDRVTSLTPRGATLALAGSVYSLWLIDALAQMMGVETWNLGSIHAPTNYHASYLLLVLCFGTLAWALGTVGLHALLRRRQQSIARALARIPDRIWIFGLSLIAFVAALTIRIVALDFGPLTDDEGAYLFSADTLRSGRLYASAPAESLFWERALFIIDDGKWFTQYFLGWPAFLAIFRTFDLHDVASPFCFALTLPFVFQGTLYASKSRFAAYVSTITLLTSPMLLVGSATLMSHACCLMVLSLLFYLVADPRRGPTLNLIRAAGVAVVFSWAFFIRPQSTLGIGGALVVFWLLSRWPWTSKPLEATSFALPAMAGAVMFLYVNDALTNDALVPPYRHLLDVLVEKSMRFGHVPPGYDISKADLNFSIFQGVSLVPAGILRLAFAGFGLPILFFAAPWAKGHWARVSLAMVGGFYALHWFSKSPGIDSFGPVHLYELMLPVSLAAGLAISRARRSFGRIASTAFAILLFVSSVGYTRSHLSNVANLADAVNDPVQRIGAFLRKQNVQRAVMFRAGRHASTCFSSPARHFVFWPPSNPPELDAPILWANHLTVERDKELLRKDFPRHDGFLYFWKACNLQIIPLEELQAGQFPDAREATPGPDWWRRKNDESSPYTTESPG